VNFSCNFFSGRLPNWLITSELLTFASFESNLLTGPFPDFKNSEEAENVTILFMGSLSLSQNFLTGTIPNSVSKMKKLVNFQIPSNQFSGTIPKFLFQSDRLQTLILERNRFYGQLPRLLNDSLISTGLTAGEIISGFENSFNISSLSSLSVGNNQLTGTLPEEYFTLATSLNSFAAGTNCFHGSIPEAICNATTLTGLILEGLSSAKACRTSIFPALSSSSSSLFNSFLLKYGIQGEIPACLFYALPAIGLIDLSGNQLEGSLPSFASSSSRYGHWNGSLPRSLQTLRLSYNELTGSIPLTYQEHTWQTLDLSYNRLTGTLVSTFNQGNSSAPIVKNASISLEVNRLSGKIPISLQNLESITMLNGNIFECENKVNSLLMGK
jgi:hypothetical protein